MSNRKFPLFLFYTLFLITIININQGSNTVSAISYVLVLLLATVCREEIDVVLLFCIYPIQRVFMISKGFMTVVPPLIVLIIIKCFLHRRVFRHSRKQLLTTFVLFCYSSLVELIRFSTIKNTVEYILTIILMVVICDIVDQEMRKTSMIVYCFSSLLSALVGYLFPVVSKYTALFTMEYNPRFQGLLTDPGTFGQTMVCAIAMIITILYLNKQERGLLNIGNERCVFQTAIAVVLCSFLLYFIILSGTRACLIAIAVIYTIVLIRLFRTERKSTFIIALMVAIVSIFALSSIGRVLISSIMSAHGGEAISDDTRFGIWSGYIQNILENPDVILFGVGMNSCSVYGKKLGLGNPHNIIIEKVVECGLIGLILNILIFQPLIKKKKMSFMLPETLPFYVWLSTLMVYGSSGSDLPYLLLALITEKSEVNENDNYKNYSDG